MAAEIRRQDQALDQLSAAIRAYLADLGRPGRPRRQRRRSCPGNPPVRHQHPSTSAISSPTACCPGDALGRAQSRRQRVRAGPHAAVAGGVEESLHLAISAFLREDLDAALLVARKKLLQRLEADASRESASVACATIAVPGWSPVTCSSAFSATTDASTIMSPPWPIRCSNAAASIRWRSGRTSQGKEGIGMRLPDLRRTPFQGRRTPAPGARPVPACNRWRCSATCCMPAACRTRPSAGAASVARIRAPTIIRSAVAATTPCASMARASSARPRRTWCWCFPVGAWPGELVQVAHAADVPLMLAYRPLSAP